LAGADFTRPVHGEAGAKSEDEETDASRGKRPFKPAGTSGLIGDRKGTRVLVQRTGSEEARARNEAEANGFGPPRRPQRGYHGKRDLKPRDESRWFVCLPLAPMISPFPPPQGGRERASVVAALVHSLRGRDAVL